MISRRQRTLSRPGSVVPAQVHARTDLVVVGRRIWAFGRWVPCVLGRGGVSGDKHEGDGATPRGTYRIVSILYRPDRLRAPAAWARPIRPGDLWCEAPEDTAYNQLVRAPYRASHEPLRRSDPLYDLVLVTDWNWPNAIPGRGSAIFVHRWRAAGHPTAGCVAMDPADLLWIAKRIHTGTRIVVR